MKPTTIQFSHANGFPAQTYTQLFNHLQDFNIEYVPVMGHGKYGMHPSWRPLGKELIENIEHHGHFPMVGIGHSLGGGALMYAAHWRPDLFKKIIFIDPPLFEDYKRMGFKILKILGLLDRFGPSGRAKTRRTKFESYEAAFEYFKPKSLFKNFDKKCFEDYVNHGLKPSESGGVELVFSARKEYEAFRETASLKGKVKFEMPSYFIYSDQHTVLTKNNVNWLENKYINTEFISFNGGHLFPLEQPAETADFLRKLIES